MVFRSENGKLKLLQSGAALEYTKRNGARQVNEIGRKKLSSELMHRSGVWCRRGEESAILISSTINWRACNSHCPN